MLLIYKNYLGLANKQQFMHNYEGVRGLTSKESFILGNLQSVLASNKSSKQKQKEIESWVYPVEKALQTSALLALVSESEVALASKLKLSDAAQNILEKSKLPPEMSFIDHKLLTVLVLEALFGVFGAQKTCNNQINATSVISSTSNLILLQMAYNNLSLVTEDSLKKESQRLLIWEQNEENFFCSKLAAKVVDSLKTSGIIEEDLIKSRGCGGKFTTKKNMSFTLEWYTLAVKKRPDKTVVPMVCKPDPWILDDKHGDSRLIEGGYLVNKGVSHEKALLGWSNEVFEISHSDLSCTNINFLQSVAFKIDQSLVSEMSSKPWLIKQYNLNSWCKDIAWAQHAGKKDSYSKKKGWEHNQATLMLSDVVYSLDFMSVLMDTPFYFIYTFDGTAIRLLPGIDDTDLCAFMNSSECFDGTSLTRPPSLALGLECHILTVFDISISESLKSSFDISKALEVLYQDILFESECFLFRYDHGILLDCCKHDYDAYSSVTAKNKSEARQRVKDKEIQSKKSYLECFDVITEIDSSYSPADSNVHASFIISQLKVYFDHGLHLKIESNNDRNFSSWAAEKLSKVKIDDSSCHEDIISFGSYTSIERGSNMHTYVHSILIPTLCDAIKYSLLESFSLQLKENEIMAKLFEDILFVADQQLFALEFGQKVFHQNNLGFLDDLKGLSPTNRKLLMEKFNAIKASYRTKFHNGLSPDCNIFVVHAGVPCEK